MLKTIINVCPIIAKLKELLSNDELSQLTLSNKSITFQHKNYQFFLGFHDETINFLKGSISDYGYNFVFELEKYGMNLEVFSNPLDETTIKLFIEMLDLQLDELNDKIHEMITTFENDKPTIYTKENY